MGIVGHGWGAALVALLATGAVHAETLDEAITAARSGPRLAGARAAYLSSSAETAIAAAHGRPTLALNGYVTHDFDKDQYGPRVRDQSGLDLTVPLFAGGRIRESVRAARANQGAARARIKAEDAELQVEVADAYTSVLEARAIAAAVREQLQHLAQYAAMIDAERRAGVASGTDAALALLRTARARAQLLEAERQEAAAAEQYRTLVGHLPGDLAPLAPAPLPFDEAGGADLARRDNPELQALRLSVTAAEHQIAAERGMGRPTLVLQGSGTYGNTGTGVTNPNVSYSFAADGSLEQLGSPRLFPHRLSALARLVLTVPFYQGGQVKARVARAQAVREDTQQRARQRENAVIAQVEGAVTGYRAAAANERLAHEAVDADREALKGVDIGRSIGDRDNLDVLNAARELTSAQIAEAHAARERAMRAIIAVAITGGSLQAVEDRLTRKPAPAQAVAGVLPIGFDLAVLSTSRPTPAERPRPLGYDLTGMG